ncbi:hypothetical protein [Actinomadura sp. NPDC000929]|uniref:hypothetical protein n=1 Tax=Actinomadura sp. NPDC000929 TaxID=3154517 RepID=UPI0033978E52
MLAELDRARRRRRDPEEHAGQLVARVPDAELDLSAGALADRALAALGTEVADLWAPR